MDYNKKACEKIANFFCDKLRKEGFSKYEKFLKENNILEFSSSDLIYCLNMKTDKDVVIKRKKIFLFDDSLATTQSNINFPPIVITTTTGTSNVSSTNCGSYSWSSPAYLPPASTTPMHFPTSTLPINPPLSNQTSSKNIGQPYFIETEEEVYLLVPKEFAEKIFILESL